VQECIKTGALVHSCTFCTSALLFISRIHDQNQNLDQKSALKKNNSTVTVSKEGALIIPSMADHRGSPGSSRFSMTFSVAAVFLAAFLTYAVTLGYSYTWDDPSLVARVQDALSSDDVSQLFTSSFYVKKAQSARYFRPVMMGSLLGDILLTGGAPWFSHLVNVLIHAINAVLVLFLLNLVLGHNAGALAGALLFAVHPVHTEAVAAVSSRMDLMALLFIFPAVMLWVSPAGNRSGRILLTWLAASLSFLLACFTKETAFMLPVVLVGWQMLQRRRPDRQMMVGMVFLIAAIAGALLTRAAVFAQEADRGMQAVKAGGLMPDTTLLTSLKILLVNMRLAILPFPGRSQWIGGALSPGTVTLLSAAVFILAAGWAMKRNFVPAGKGLIWWTIFTLPVLGLFNLGQTVAAERYAYIPSVGFCLMFGALVASLPVTVLGNRAFRAAGLAMIFFLGTWGAVHSGPWKNEVALFRYIVHTNPGYPNGYLNLGVALSREGRNEEAMKAYDKARELVPGWVDAAFNRGNLFYRMGRYEEALTDFDSVLKKEPGDWEASLNRGNVLVALGRNDEAVRSYRDAMAVNASSGKPLVGLGVLAARDGEFTRAVRLFTNAATREPVLTEAYEGLGGSYLAMGMHGMAEDAFQKALEISPGNTRAAMKLGWFLLGTGRPVKADHAFGTALAADPSLLEAWVGLVRSLDAAGEKSKADGLIQEMGRTDPTLADGVIKSRKGGSSQPENR